MAKKKTTKVKVVKANGTTPPSCPQGYIWNGKACVPDVG